MSLAEPWFETLHIQSAISLIMAQQKTNCDFRTFRVKESFWAKQQSCITLKVSLRKWCPFFVFKRERSLLTLLYLYNVLLLPSFSWKFTLYALRSCPNRLLIKLLQQNDLSSEINMRFYNRLEYCNIYKPMPLLFNTY